MDESHTLDLEAELQNDVSGARRADLVARLRALQDECLANKRQLSEREGYRRLQAAGAAVKAAIRIVEKLPHARGNGN